MGCRPSNKGSNTSKDGDQHSSTVRRPWGHPKSTQNLSQSQDGSIQSTDRSEAITTAHDNASWAPVDVECMLEVLESHKAAAGDGNAVVEECNKVLTEGGRKTMAACKNKYGQLVKTFNIICNIRRVSGWHWSDETGASINAESTSTWDDYAHKHKDAKPFHNHGWQYLAAMEKLQGSSEPKGKYIFHSLQEDIGILRSQETQDAKVASQPSIDGHEGSQDWDDSFIASQHSAHDDDDETQSIKEALAPTEHALLEATPHQTQKAIEQVQDLEDWLSTSQMISLMTIFEKDSRAADAYVMLEREDVCKAWVQGKLKLVPSDESDPFNAV
ncbi:hypothetical protein EDD18DRAFT_1111944 [Armillaria luteobubalina]|uniref:Myb/SANT-like domain-containing protein n=1 Tax=Armillaria luteobubalina TaxID=153913 RepID=A0AA39PHM0_9AGAR|nr:hypothetical protein EDD18DRAFT_1111944 [Armillaria luteobubalina]